MSPFLCVCAVVYDAQLSLFFIFFVLDVIREGERVVWVGFHKC